MTEHRETSEASSPPAPVPLDPTGVPGLDEVLGGGIQRGSLAILAGPPGGGKTILAHQIAFSAAQSGRRTTILTAFSEPTNKLITHMHPFTFFDEALLGQSLDVLSIQQFLRQGLEAAASEIVGVVRAAKANLVVLDGFRGVRETAERPEDARGFIYDVSNRLSLLGITLLLTCEAHVRDVAFFPEATTADVLLGLAFDAIEAHERRTLEVLKVRGAAPLTGQHALAIGKDGVTIYPRLEARVARLAGVDRSPALPRVPSAQTEQAAPTGVPGLDPLIGGGFGRGTSTLVVGGRGAGKTLLGLQFALQGARSGEPGLFVSFRETAERLMLKAAPFQWADDLHGALDSGMLTVLRTPPVELQADALAGSMLALLDELQARRLVLDEIGEIERTLTASGYAQRFHDFIAALVEALRLRGVTALLMQHLAAKRRSTLVQSDDPAGTLSDNLLWLRQAPRRDGLRRSLAIVQTSLSNRSGAWHRITIQPPAGIVVLDAAVENATLDGNTTRWHAERVEDMEGEEQRDDER